MSQATPHEQINNVMTLLSSRRFTKDEAAECLERLQHDEVLTALRYAITQVPATQVASTLVQLVGESALLTLRFANDHKKPEAIGWYDVEGVSTESQRDQPINHRHGKSGFLTKDAAIKCANGSYYEDFYRVQVIARGAFETFSPADVVFDRFERD